MVNKKYGFINAKGEEVIPCEYEKPVVPKDGDLRAVKNAPKFVNGVAVIFKNGLYGVINKTGKIVVPIEYQFMTHFKHNLAVFQKDLSAANTKGVVDVNGNIIVKPTKFNKNLWIEDDNLIRFNYVDGVYSNFFGFYNNKGLEVNETSRFEYLSEFENGIALFGTKKEPNYWGIVDALGNTKPLLEKYTFGKSELRQFRNGYLYPRKLSNKKMVVLNKKGERVNNNCEYDYLYDLNSDGIAYGIKGTTNATFYDDKACSVIYETSMNGQGSMNYIFSSLSKIYPFKGGYAAINKDFRDNDKEEVEYILIDKKGKTTYSIIGGRYCSLAPDKAEIGIFIYNQKDLFNFEMPTYNLYLKGNGTILYKSDIGSRDFNDGMAAVMNFVNF